MIPAQLKVCLALAVALATATASPPKCLPTNSTCFPDAEAWASLDSKLSTEVLCPSRFSSSWNDAIAHHNKRIDTSPFAAVQALSQEDVVAVVDFVRTYNLLLSIKSTGHCYSGNCVQDDSIVLDLSKMNSISLAPTRDSITIGPGSNFDALYSLNSQTGTQSVGGMCGTVGPVGFSLGGGHGPLIRSYGLGADQILSVSLVLASGEAVSITQDADPDLFWALQGGAGGSFGVVTSITLKTYPAPPQLTSYTCNYPLSVSESTAEGKKILTSWWSNIMPNLPNAWHFFTIIAPQPIPMEMKIPSYDKDTMKGVLSLEGLYNGDYASAKAALADLEALSPSLQLDCSYSNHTDFLAWHSSRWFGKTPVDMRSYMSTSLAQAGFDAASLADTAIDAIINSSNMMSTFFGIQTGGSVQNGGGSVSDAWRGSVLLMETDANWLMKSNDESNVEWTSSTGSDIASLEGIKGSYVNEPDPALDSWEDEFWGSNFARLQEVKARVDPDEVFSCWQCVHL